MAEPRNWSCYNCGSLELTDGFDGFFYCLHCGSQADDIIDTGVADEDLVIRDIGEPGGPIYSQSHTRRHVLKVEPISQSQSHFNTSQSPCWENLTLEEDPYDNEAKNKDDILLFDDIVGPSGPEDFGSSGVLLETSFEEYADEVRMRYVMGLQLMIELQCEVMVKEFKVSPIICGFAATIWLRFVTATRVFKDDWAFETIQDSEKQCLDLENSKPISSRHRAEPHNLYGQRAVVVWYRSLRKKIPLSYTLALSFLVCHIAREAILPTDIMKWSMEGKLPYFAAFNIIGKRIGQTSRACPISSKHMFRPSRIPPVQKLESSAALIAHTVGLNIPPINFQSIACRYLNKLALPAEKIFLHACRIYEWSMPPDLWLSTNEQRIPSRVCVMSILIISIRILYNLHGFGYWEKSLSVNSDASFPYQYKPELTAVKLLQKIEARYHEIAETYEYSRDLPTYLQHCKDVIFAELESLFEDPEEEKMIEQFWNYYQNEKDSEQAEDEDENVAFSYKRLKKVCDDQLSNESNKFNDKDCFSGASSENKTSKPTNPQEVRAQPSESSRCDDKLCSEDEASKTFKDEAIRRMKLEMEENKFYYVPPRVNLKRFDYLHYSRKIDEGSLTYAVHADYYILLRACARAAQVDVRIMHVGVLSLEKRLAWLENRIHHCIHLPPSSVSCEFCSDVVPENTTSFVAEKQEEPENRAKKEGDKAPQLNSPCSAD